MALSTRWDAPAHASCSHSTPWKAISQVYSSFLPFTSFKVGLGGKILFWEDHWAGEAPFSTLFPRLYQLSTLHSATISSYLLRDGDSQSWNLHLRRNPQDWELLDFCKLLDLLDSASFPTQPDKRGWLLNQSSSFFCASFFSFLTYALGCTVTGTGNDNFRNIKIQVRHRNRKLKVLKKYI